MSLEKAVLEIANAMDGDGQDRDLDELQMYAKMLRVAVKAAEGSQQAAAFSPFAFGGSAEVQHTKFVEAEREKLQREKRLAEGSERFEVRMLPAVGGDADGDVVSIDPAMPSGSRTMVGDQVYVLGEDGRLCYSEEETKKSISPKGPPAPGIMSGRN